MYRPTADGVVKIAPVKFRNWCADNHRMFKEISQAMGHNDAYISKVVSAGEFPARQFQLFLTLFHENAATFLPDTRSPLKLADAPYSLTLDVKPDKVHVGVSFNGEEVYGAWAEIRGTREVDLVKSISYAAHMCYKIAEQKEFSGR